MNRYITDQVSARTWPRWRSGRFDSQAAPLALALVLVEAMADAAPLRAQARLEEYKKMIDGVFRSG